MPKKYKCTYCKKYSEDPIKTNVGRFCDIRCATDYGKEKAQKQREQAKKRLNRDNKKKAGERKKKFYDSDRSTRTKAAQKAFNDFIRARDDRLPCVSCGRFHKGQWHAGHYRTTGAHPELRFCEFNCHKQCSVCNNHKSGNIAEYRIELVKRIGIEQVEWLEGPHDPKKYTCEELKEIELFYKRKLKELADKSIINDT